MRVRPTGHLCDKTGQNCQAFPSVGTKGLVSTCVDATCTAPAIQIAAFTMNDMHVAGFWTCSMDLLWFNFLLLFLKL